MGDRANLVIREAGVPDLFYYTHSSGTEWPELLRDALAVGRGRWGDSQYLNRILARELFADLVGDTGGGISTYAGDNEYDYLILRHDGIAGTVYAVRPGDGDSALGKVFTFAEYVALDEAQWANLTTPEAAA